MAKKKNADEQAYQTLCANVRTVLNTEPGKELIWSILSMCNLYGESFTGNSQTFFLEGKRSIGLEILQLLEDSDKSIYPKLLLRAQT